MDPVHSGSHDDDRETGVLRVLRRLPTYIYLHDLFHDQRVLEIGCGDGAAAAYLARSGARSVVGVERHAGAVEQARLRHRMANLSFLHVDEHGLAELDDRSFDVVCVPPALPALLEPARWVGFLEEVRRVLVRGGTVVVSAPSADGDLGGARAGGLSYHDLVARLEPLFGAVRMVGVQPFVGVSLVEFDDDEELGDLELDTTLASLGQGRDGVVEYVAVAGGQVEERDPRGYLLVELPAAEGAAALAESRGRALARAGERQGDRLREAESAYAEALLRIKQLEQEGRRGSDDGELRRRLARAVEERTAAEAEVETLRSRLARAEEEIGLVAAQAATELAEANHRVQESEQAARAAAAQGQVADESAEELALSRQVIEELTQAAARHAEEASTLARALEERDLYVEELRLEFEAAAQAARDGSHAAREATMQHGQLEDEVRRLRQRLAEAEGALLAARQGAPVADSGRIAELEEKLAASEASGQKLGQRWKEAEAKSDELWRKIGDMQREMESAREAAVENARAQRQAAQISLTRAVDEASRKLVSAKDELARTERERQELEKEVVGLRAARAALEGRLGEMEARASAAEEQVGQGGGDDSAALREALRRAEAQLLEERDAREAAQVELEFVRGELTQTRHEMQTAVTPAPAWRAPDPALTERVDEVSRALRDIEEAVAAEEAHLRDIESAVWAVRDAAPDVLGGGSEEAALLAERVRALSNEVGQRDAELATLHGALAAGRRRAADLADRILELRDRALPATAGEMAQILERLAEETARLGS